MDLDLALDNSTLRSAPCHVNCARKRGTRLADEIYQRVSSAWEKASWDFRFADLEKQLCTVKDLEQLSRADRLLALRIDESVRHILDKRGLQPLLSDEAARAADTERLFILKDDLAFIIEQGKSMRSDAGAEYSAWMNETVEACHYESLTAPATPAALADYFATDASTDRPEMRRHALMLISALERQAWLLTETGRRIEPIAQEIPGLRDAFLKLFFCADPVVRRAALHKLLGITDITPIENDSAEDIVSFQQRLMEIANSEDRSREHQLLLYEIYSRVTVTMDVLQAAEKLPRLEEERRDAIWDGATAFRKRFAKLSEHDSDRFDGRRYAYKFWADYAEQAAQYLVTNVTEAQRWMGRIALLSQRAFDIAKTLAAFSNPVTAIQGIGIALETIEKTIQTVKEVSYHVEWKEQWFKTVLELDRIASIFLADPVAFEKVVNEVQEIKRGRYDPNLFYGVLECMERVIHNSPVPEVQEEALKLVLQYLTVDAPLIQCRGLLILCDLVPMGGRLGNTAYALLRFLQASDWVRSREGREILQQFCDNSPLPPKTAKSRWAVKGSEQQLEIFSDVIKFLLVRVAQIKDEQEYGGHSLGTFVSLLTASAEDAVLPELLEVFKDLAIKLEHPELYREPDVYGNTPYHIAALRRNLPMLDLVRRSFQPDINAQDHRKGNTALHIAAIHGHADVASKLLRMGAKANLRNQEGFTPLHIASLRGDQETLRILLEGGAHADAVAADGRSALNIAIEADNVALVDALLERGARIAEHMHDCTATIIAALSARPRVLTYLITRRLNQGYTLGSLEAFRVLGYLSADGRNLTGSETFARFHLQMLAKHPSYAASFDKFRGHVAMPIMDGTRIRMQPPVAGADRFGSTALILAAANPAKIDELTSLIEEGNLNEGNFLGVTALHAAAATGNLEGARALLAAGANVDVATEWGFTPLMLGAYYRDEAMVTLFLDHDANVNAVNDFGDTPLLCASGLSDQRRPDSVTCLGSAACIQPADSGGDSIIALLEEAGASATQADFSASNSLHHAVSAGSPEVVKYLCKTHPELFWESDARGEIPLAAAIKAGRVKIVDALLSNQYEGDLRQIHEELIARCCKGGSLGNMLAEAGLVESFERLVEAVPEAVSLHDNTAQQNTPLHSAAQSGQCAIVELYIKHGWPTCLRDHFDNTPLHIASLRGHQSCQRLLMPPSQSVCLRNRDLRTPLHLAAAKGQPGMLDIFMSDPKNVLRRDGHGELPLHVACRYGRIENAVRLIDAYPQSINWRNDDGESAFYIATKLGHLELAKALLARGADSEQASLTGMTPLLVAAQEGQSAMVNYLLDTVQANIKACDEEDESALHKAVFRQHLDIVTKLLQKDLTLAYPEAERLVNLRDMRGETALHELAKLKREATDEVSIRILVLLLRYGANIYTPDEAGNNFIHQLCYNGQRVLLSNTEHFIAKLYGQRLDARPRNKRGDNYLHSAIRGSARMLVRACAEPQQFWPKGIDINQQNDDGLSAPMLAAKLGHWELLQDLLATQNIKPKLRDNQGRSLLNVILAQAELPSLGYQILMTILDDFPELATRCDENDRSPLHWIAINNHELAFDSLIAALRRRKVNLRKYREARDKSGLRAEEIARRARYNQLAGRIQNLKIPPSKVSLCDC